jgi:O-antigen biosynthesis protein WbqV
MGEAVRVIDVARQMIRLSGKEPDRDIEVKIVGLRPGEKLFEELFDSNELRLAGPADGVLAARSVPRRVRELAAIVCELEQMAVRGSELPLRTLLADSVPSVRARKGGDIKGKERTAA